MKKLLLFISLLLYISCQKENTIQCTTCTSRTESLESLFIYTDSTTYCDDSWLTVEQDTFLVFNKFDEMSIEFVECHLTH